jgi:hypothetical protein
MINNIPFVTFLLAFTPDWASSQSWKRSALRIRQYIPWFVQRKTQELIESEEQFLFATYQIWVKSPVPTIEIPLELRPLPNQLRVISVLVALEYCE